MPFAFELVVYQTGYTYNQLYGKFASIEDRFPNIHGSKRWNLIKEVYVRDEKYTLKLWNRNGEVIWRRSLDNPRSQGSLVTVFKDRFLKEGFFQNMRSAVIVKKRKESTDPNARDGIAGATVCESIVEGALAEPDNEYVQGVLDKGLPDCLDIDDATPADIIAWIKNLGNSFLVGGKYNALEMIEDTVDADDKWQSHRVAHNISHGNCPTRGDLRFDKIKERWILPRYKQQFDNNWHSFTSASALRIDAIKNGYWGNFKVEARGACMSTQITHRSQPTMVENQPDHKPLSQTSRRQPWGTI